GWLKRLVKAILTCAFIRSVMLKFFVTEKSTTRVGGPRQSPIGAFPIVPKVKPSMVYRFGLTKWRSEEEENLGFLQGCPGTKFGRDAPAPFPIPEGSLTFDSPPMVGV